MYVIIMGSGAGPAGQLWPDHFFASLIIHKMIGVSLGLICFLEITANIYSSTVISSTERISSDVQPKMKP